MSIHDAGEGKHKIRWREGGHNRSLVVHGSRELARKVLRKKMSARDENRHLDVKREVNFRMTALIDRYWQLYGVKKRSASREKHVLEGVRQELGPLFVREVDGPAVDGWYRKLTEEKGLKPGTAARHFNVMHHMMGKAATIWSKETGIDRNPADQVEVKRPDDARERYLTAEELPRLKAALDEKLYRKGTRAINQTFYRLRLIVLVALTTGMRSAEIFGLGWSDVLYREELIAVRAKLKSGKMRYVPLTPKLAEELRRYPAVLGEQCIGCSPLPASRSQGLSHWHQGSCRRDGSEWRVTTRVARWGSTSGMRTEAALSRAAEAGRGAGILRQLPPPSTLTSIEHSVANCASPSSTVRFNPAHARLN